MHCRSHQLASQLELVWVRATTLMVSLLLDLKVPSILSAQVKHFLKSLKFSPYLPHFHSTLVESLIFQVGYSLLSLWISHTVPKQRLIASDTLVTSRIEGVMGWQSCSLTCNHITCENTIYLAVTIYQLNSLRMPGAVHRPTGQLLTELSATWYAIYIRPGQDSRFCIRSLRKLFLALLQASSSIMA